MFFLLQLTRFSQHCSHWRGGSKKKTELLCTKETIWYELSVSDPSELNDLVQLKTSELYVCLKTIAEG